MKIFEFERRDMETAYYDPAEDKVSVPTAMEEDKLTLRKLNKLKKMREMQRLEDLKRQDLISVMYGSGGQDDASGMGF